MTALQTHRSRRRAPLLSDNLTAYNETCARIAADCGFIAVDLYPHLDERHISPVDCIHPNVSGLVEIAARFIAAMETTSSISRAECVSVHEGRRDSHL